MTHDDGLTPLQTAYLDSQAHREAFSDLSAQQVNAMSYEDYARRTGRQTLGQLAAQTLYTPPAPPEAPRIPQQAPAVPEAWQPVDVSSLSMSDYQALRGQLGVQGREYGRGILSDQGGTNDWIAAAQRKSGRAGMNERNVQQAARPDADKYLHANDPVQGRQGFYR